MHYIHLEQLKVSMNDHFMHPLFFENTTTDFKTIRELTFEMSCCMIGADVEDQLKENNILSIHREHYM